MKLLSVFLAVLTLALSVSPCCGDSNQVSAESTAGHCEHQDDNKEPCGEQGLCSPFYACGSCPGFTLNQVSPALTAGEPRNNVVPALYLERPSKEVFSPTFKPPRII